MAKIRPCVRTMSPLSVLLPPPLCSARITRLLRSYGWLRLPPASALFLASYTCPRVRLSNADWRISLVTT